MEERVLKQIKQTNKIEDFTLWVAHKRSEIFLQNLRTIIQFSKEVAHIIEEQMKFQYICLCWITFFLLVNLKYQPIFMLIVFIHFHVGSFISCNHMLARDINAQRKPVKAFCENNWLYGIYNKDYCTLSLVQLCATSPLCQYSL